MTTCYWWIGDNHDQLNLGDSLSPVLLSHFADIDVTWAPPDEADIICTGSVLDVMPHTGWTGYVLGAGQLHDTTLTDLVKQQFSDSRTSYE